jgi:hypothetical protein
MKGEYTEREKLIMEEWAKYTLWEIQVRDKRIKLLERTIGAGIAGIMIASYFIFF